MQNDDLIGCELFQNATMYNIRILHNIQLAVQ